MKLLDELSGCYPDTRKKGNEFIYRRVRSIHNDVKYCLLDEIMITMDLYYEVPACIRYYDFKKYIELDVDNLYLNFVIETEETIDSISRKIRDEYSYIHYTSKFDLLDWDVKIVNDEVDINLIKSVFKRR